MIKLFRFIILICFLQKTLGIAIFDWLVKVGKKRTAYPYKEIPVSLAELEDLLTKFPMNSSYMTHPGEQEIEIQGMNKDGNVVETIKIDPGNPNFYTNKDGKYDFFNDTVPWNASTQGIVPLNVRTIKIGKEIEVDMTRFDNWAEDTKESKR